MAAFLIALIAGPAAARSCADAQRALARAEAGGGGGGQAAELRNQLRAFGCNTNSMFGRAPQCAGIEARLRRVSGGADSRTVRRLRNEVASACAAPAREPQRVVRSERQRNNGPNGDVIIHGTRADNGLDERSRGGNFFTRLFGGASRDEVVVETVRADPRARSGNVERYDAESERRRRDAGSDDGVRTLATGGGGKRLREGGYRTVCVRLCDGFYFPINSRSHSDNFYEELAMCVGRCPGADVSLYVHSGGDPVESMRSAMTGEPYARLPTAFVYRKALVPSCGCEPQSTIAADASAEKALSFVGAGEETGAAAAATTAAAGGAWTPLKAVYDETGEPLDLSIGVDTTGKGAAGSAHPSTVAAGSESTPVAVSSVTTATTNEPPISRIREVGGQFYSDAPAERAMVRASVPRLLPGSSSAVTIVPIPKKVVAPAATSAIAPAATSATAAPARTSAIDGTTAVATTTTGG